MPLIKLGSSLHCLEGIDPTKSIPIIYLFFEGKSIPIIKWLS